MRNALAFAVLSFVLCKLSFFSLSWLVAEKTTAFDWKCIQHPHPQLLHNGVQRLRDMPWPAGLCLLIATSLVYHTVCFFPALELLALLESLVFELPYQAGDGVWQFVYLDPHDRLWPWGVYALIAVCGIGCDGLSGFVGWSLLKAADRSRFFSGLPGFLIANVVFVLVLCGGSALFLFIVVSLSLPRAINYQDVVLLVPHAMSVGIPTLAYCGAGFAILALRRVPTGFRVRLSSRSGHRPLLPNLGTALGTLSALLVGLLSFMVS